MPGLRTNIRICSLFGSPREGGGSDRVHQSYLACCSDAEILRINVKSLTINPCIGCGACREISRCCFSDDMTQIYHSIRGADLITVSFPLYFSSLPSHVKAVVDRCQLLWEEFRRGEYPRANQTCIAFVTAGSEYPGMSNPSYTVLKHLMNSIGGRFDAEHSVLVPGLDGADGNAKLESVINTIDRSWIDIFCSDQ